MRGTPTRDGPTASRGSTARGRRPTQAAFPAGRTDCRLCGPDPPGAGLDVRLDADALLAALGWLLLAGLPLHGGLLTPRFIRPWEWWLFLARPPERRQSFECGSFPAPRRGFLVSGLRPRHEADDGPGCEIASGPTRICRRFRWTRFPGLAIVTMAWKSGDRSAAAESSEVNSS